MKPRKKRHKKRPQRRMQIEAVPLHYAGEDTIQYIVMVPYGNVPGNLSSVAQKRIAVGRGKTKAEAMKNMRASFRKNKKRQQDI